MAISQKPKKIRRAQRDFNIRMIRALGFSAKGIIAMAVFMFIIYLLMLAVFIYANDCYF